MCNKAVIKKKKQDLSKKIKRSKSEVGGLSVRAEAKKQKQRSKKAEQRSSAVKRRERSCKT